MIAIDWGTSSLRGYLLDANGSVLEQRRGSDGILACQGRFAEVLSALIDGWAGPVLLSGMIGSRNGWVEQAYLPCPADTAALAQAMRGYDDLLPGRTLWFVPGVSTGEQHGVPEASTGERRSTPDLSASARHSVPDVMRGEETQLVGLIAALGDGEHVACLPGTHSKWAQIANGQLTGFATVMTGELYAVLRQHSILGKLMQDDHAELDSDAFLQGVDRSGEPGGLSHHLFGARTLGLFDRLTATALPSYLSGLLIGHELRDHRGDHGTVHLVGSPALAQRYALALAHLGVKTQLHPEDLAATGLFALARQRGLA
ncbi:2-dehydro-3-deoxygalactonokinase [Xanthomonas sp. WHRI 8391]|uniref:Putative 2-dehydro-3-deoxygalactonokinase DgoK1 n=1 Tax=Xanthomonas hortorum pv. carotae TaxID=487904 RepID=A0A6V7EPF3_9XANT|nr:2-dehydro-3-deoxygalactonokinase [Xanthomonas hortorum]ETC88422.1 2-dehydro-3-deoxygalactonokinase [Xanthomonas hortorum pv. carotae str. M081]MBG3849038.1 2-dehydro-3-deoxygalactonokinase [Xanthomonas hortorum pv. carotae]UTS71933.1 2-dehydro-3-deoxygalactonokinase [Xanthomonas hortorum]CAD0353136.1 putative 2-dehydro-3-deoxygalactonokinase DgoK1 [Xanthomonas hortorum pv. carotae]CAD0353143.1 putative 2-dehydro-3-deoxygalactonokinase DgoK1 [Xanthomonas hortorum pv. carotae]